MVSNQSTGVAAGPGMIELSQLDTVAGVLAGHARERATAPALITKEARYTYQELHERVRRFAAGLRELGVGPGTPVALLCTNRAEWVVGALATMTAGARVAAVNTWSRSWDLDHLLRTSDCEVLLAVSSFGDTSLEPLLRGLIPEAWSAAPGWSSANYPRLREVVLIGAESVPPGARSFNVVSELGREIPEPVSGRDDVALVLYTSGSTARPKAVSLLQGQALEHGFDVGVRMNVSAEDRIWVPVPLFWSYGGGNALMVALAHGACLVLQELFEPHAALELIEAEACTVAYTLPNITAALLGHPSFDPERVTSLVRGMTIGSPRDVRAAVEDLGIAEICNAYGSTEIYGGATVTPHDWPTERKFTCQGPPLPRIALTVRGADDEVVPAGEVGEIIVSGQVTPGYLDQPAENERAFGPHGEFRTGDLGYVDAEGNLHFVARATEMIKSGGINISPGEIEEFLHTHPDVVDAAVVGTTDERQGQVAVGFVTVVSTTTIDEPALRGYCREHIASFKVPAMILVSTEALPVTDTGKLARGVLHDRAAEAWGTKDS